MDRPAVKRYESGPRKPPPGARREFQEKSKRKRNEKSEKKSDKSILMSSDISGVEEEAREVYGLRAVKRKPGKHKV